MAGGYCTVDGCDLEEEAGGLCQGHRKRRVEGRVVAGELKETDLSGFERVLEAIKEMDLPRYDGAEGERAWRARLRAAAWGWLDPGGQLRDLARAARRRRRGAGPRWDRRRKPLPRRRER